MIRKSLKGSWEETQKKGQGGSPILTSKHQRCLAACGPTIDDLLQVPAHSDCVQSMLLEGHLSPNISRQGSLCC